jgi:hypothetical protein
VKGRKIVNQQTITETFNHYIVAIAENVNRPCKNNCINDDNILVLALIIIIVLLEKAFNKPCPSEEHKCTTTKETEQNINPPKRRDIHKVPEYKLPFHKFPTMLHM